MLQRRSVGADTSHSYSMEIRSVMLWLRYRIRTVTPQHCPFGAETWSSLTLTARKSDQPTCRNQNNYIYNVRLRSWISYITDYAIRIIASLILGSTGCGISCVCRHRTGTLKYSRKCKTGIWTVVNFTLPIFESVVDTTEDFK